MLSKYLINKNSLHSLVPGWVPDAIIFQSKKLKHYENGVAGGDVQVVHVETWGVD